MGKNSKKSRRKRSASADEASRSKSDTTTTAASASSSSSDVNNPLLKAQSKYLSSLPTIVRQHFFSDRHVDSELRAEIWTQQADIGEDLVNKYAWATPDDRAFKILRHYSPIVEIGCGANCYWAKKMHSAGIDVVAYDVAVDDGGKISPEDGHTNKKKKKKKGKRNHGEDENGDERQFAIRRGGPKILSADPIRESGRSLFLCYPDEDDAAAAEPDDATEPYGPPVSMGAECLEHFQGDIVIHVGELNGDTLSMDQAPWGRSSAPEFQQRLAAEYHCLLKASLPSWLHVRDTISVWKRSETCTMVFEGDSDDKNEDKDGNESGEEIEYKYIAPDETLPQDIAAPCLQHLLDK